jgi:hypothetical protein
MIWVLPLEQTAAKKERAAMALPSPDEVKTWGGKVIVDRAGLPIGTVTQVYTDDDTGLPEWATIRLGEAAIFLPLLGAVEQDGQVRVTVRRDDVAKAPAVLDRDHITPDEEVRLYRYYGIPYTPRPSGNVLPTGEGPPPPAGAVAAVERFASAQPVRVALAALAGASAALVTVAVALLGLRRRRARRATRTSPKARIAAVRTRRSATSRR